MKKFAKNFKSRKMTVEKMSCSVNCTKICNNCNCGGNVANYSAIYSVTGTVPDNLLVTGSVVG